MWVLLLGCQVGTMRTTYGTTPMVTALHMVLPDTGDQDVTRVLLSNSALPCDAQVPSAEPTDTGFGADDRQNAYTDLVIALSRENSRIVMLDLHRFELDSWAAFYPLSAASPTGLSGRNPTQAQASYYGVNEAVMGSDQGLEQTYTPTDVEVASNVDAPGWVEISRDADGKLSGAFSLDPVEVSGRFRSEPCDVDFEDSTLYWIEFYARQITDPTEETD